MGLGIVFASVYSVYSASCVTEKNIVQKGADASALFEKHCDTCHGKDGQAKNIQG